MPKRKWGHQAEYILTLMGWNIGVGSIWKFPYMCARNGGGSYLIPYLFFTLIGSVPLTYLEMFLGQYIQRGVFGAWDICPVFKGLAGGAVFLCGLFSVYYSTFFSWILYYLFYSFFPVLPWTQCGQSWNSLDCVEDFGNRNTSLLLNKTAFSDGPNGYTFQYINSSTQGSGINSSERYGVPAAEEFFRNNVLQITDGLEDMGTLRWPLVLCLVVTFLTVYICIIKGIRLSGKVVYVTVTCPYILVTVILIRSLTLPGSVDGILFYITPNFDRLKDFSVWMEACSFALYAPGISYGIIVKMAAHNPTDTNCYRDAFLVNIVCALSQVYFGFSVFGITGHLAHVRGVTMEHYKTSGFKLGFITYPEATSYLPLPQLWSVLLFTMLFTLGIDSLIPPIEVVTDAVGDKFPRVAKRRWLLNAVVMVPFFFLALPYIAQGGVYLLTLVEWFAFFPSLLLFSVMECVAVAWIYGIPRLDQAMTMIWGTKVTKDMVIFWKFICPVILMVIFGYSFYSYRPPQFEDYIYPDWANVIGWFISATIVLPLPVYFLWSVWRVPGETTLAKLSNVCKPKGQWDVRDTDDVRQVADIQDRESFLKEIQETEFGVAHV